MEKQWDSYGAEDVFPRASARDLALILFKRKWSVVAVFLVTMLGFLFWMFVIRDETYVVSTKVLVKFGREQAPPPSVMGAPPQLVAYRSEDVNSEMAIFQSTDSVAQVVDELHLDRPIVEPVPAGFFARAKYETKRVMHEVKDWYEGVLVTVGLRPRLTPKEKTVFGLMEGLKVASDKDSTVFIASLALPYRHGSAGVLNALLDKYLVKRQELYSNGGASFFRSSLNDATAQLHASEERLQEFENDKGIADLIRQETILLDHVAQARAAWKEEDYTRREDQGRVDRLDQELKKPNPDFAAIAEFEHEGFRQTLIKQLADLQREREQLRMTYLDSTDRVQNNRKQYDALASMLTVNMRTALEEVTQQEQLRRASYDALQKELDDLHDKQMKWADLKRNVGDAEANYLLYRRKYEESLADETMERERISNVAVIERASEPLAPAGMRKTMLLGLATLACILTALLWVTIAEFFDHGIYTVEALQREVDAPVLAAIPSGTRLRRMKAV